MKIAADCCVYTNNNFGEHRWQLEGKRRALDGAAAHGPLYRL